LLALHTKMAGLLAAASVILHAIFVIRGAFSGDWRSEEFPSESHGMAHSQNASRNLFSSRNMDQKACARGSRAKRFASSI
jgi:hypothetical protein